VLIKTSTHQLYDCYQRCIAIASLWQCFHLNFRGPGVWSVEPAMDDVLLSGVEWIIPCL